MSSRNPSPLAGNLAHAGNLLHPAIRRDIADLNRLYLERALDPLLRDDAWFRLPTATLGRLSTASAEARERTAGCPICLFELTIPDTDDPAHWATGAVNDALPVGTPDAASEIRRAFGLVALSVARRLAEGAPLSSRIAFGFGQDIETRLTVLSPSAAYRLAAWPGLVQPRWIAHPRYWRLLADAAAGGCTETLHWAYAAGFCLLAPCEREPPAPGPGPKRVPRVPHRRPMRGGGEVPC